MPFRIAEARAQFALGNVALALEAFRIALREDPNSIDAMTGVAACYDRMARFDLSRRHYEAALAIAPGDPLLLAAFASSLDLQGRVAEAASVRQEIKQRTALASLKAAPQPAPVASVAAPVAVMAAPPKPVAPAALPPPPLALASRAEPVRQTVRADRPAPAAMAPMSPTKLVQTAQAPSVRVAPPAPTATPTIGRSVTVVLPPARPVAAAPPAPPKLERAAIVAPACRCSRCLQHLSPCQRLKVRLWRHGRSPLPVRCPWRQRRGQRWKMP